MVGSVTGTTQPGSTPSPEKTPFPAASPTATWRPLSTIEQNWSLEEEKFTPTTIERTPDFLEGAEFTIHPGEIACNQALKNAIKKFQESLVRNVSKIPSFGYFFYQAVYHYDWPSGFQIATSDTDNPG